jgi:hypothetical protein
MISEYIDVYLLRIEYILISFTYTIIPNNFCEHLNQTYMQGARHFCN